MQSGMMVEMMDSGRLLVWVAIRSQHNISKFLMDLSFNQDIVSL